MISFTLITSPFSVSAPVGHTFTHSPHPMHFVRSTQLGFSGPIAPCRHAFMHFPHPMHFFWSYITSGSILCDSGLQHHRQESGQPFKNTMDRIPGPSFTEKRWISNTTPFSW